MEMFKLENFFDLNQTIAKQLFCNIDYPWKVIPEIRNFILNLGEHLPKSEFEQIQEHVWIEKSASISNSAHVGSPCIICKNAEVRHCAFIRSSAIIGEECVVGNSTELKNVILFNKVQVPHYNYVGDSILGYKSHLGAGAITSNVKSNRSSVTIKYNGQLIETGLKKFGAIIGDSVEIGCNTVLNPGTIIGKNSIVYPLSSVRGFVSQNSIYKSESKIVDRI